MSNGEILAIILSVLAVFMRGILAAADTAMASVGRKDAVAMTEKGLWGASRLVRLKDNPDDTLSVIRATQMTCLALAAALAGWAVVSLVQETRFWINIGFSSIAGSIFLAITGGLLLGFLAFLIGDMVPRAWAAARPAMVARFFAYPVSLLKIVMYPWIKADHFISDKLLPGLGVSPGRISPSMPLEEIEKYLAEHAARGTVSAETPEMIHSVLEFGQTIAKEVMVPRTRVVGIEVNKPASEIISTICSRGHTRLPVYENDLDNVIGIVNAKDILPLVAEGEPIELPRLVRSVPFVPWSKPINQLMRELQGRHVHMAMVIDEFGGLMGLITLEDIIEEIVGEIEDEFDPVESRDVETLSDGSSMVRASIDIEEFNQAFNSEIPVEGPYETLAGFLNTLAGAIPKEGDTFFHDGIQFTIVKRSDRRIRQVRVVRKELRIRDSRIKDEGKE